MVENKAAEPTKISIPERTLTRLRQRFAVAQTAEAYAQKVMAPFQQDIMEFVNDLATAKEALGLDPADRSIQHDLENGFFLVKPEEEAPDTNRRQPVG